LLFQPSPLPTGHLGRLAYSLDGDIYLADWDGSNPVRIADGLPGDGTAACGSYGGEGPMWSPDGRHLAYRYDCDVTVRISDAEGHQVASFPGAGWQVAWSPDSSRVATWVEMPKTIGVYGLDGVRQALVTLPSGFGTYRDEDPVWSRDGASPLISLRPEPGLSPRQTWELPIDGRTPSPVPEGDPRSHFDAAYSRDGARMAFVGDSDSVSLVIAKADGTTLRVLQGAKADPIYGLYGPGGVASGAMYDSPVVSPTGDRVAFVWSPAVDAPDSSSELRVVDVATGTVTTLSRGSGDRPIRFSPEGDRVLFSRTDASGETSLWSVRVDGSDARLLVSGTDWGDWQWQPAGSTAMPSPPPTPATPAATPRGAALQTYAIGAPYLANDHSVILELPSGWTTDGRLIVKDRGLPSEVGVSAWTIAGIYADPCHWQGSPAVPSAELTGLGMVTALLDQKGASQVTSDIHRGPWSEWPIELSVPADLDVASCDQGQYRSWSDLADPTAGNANHRAGQIDVVYIIDLDRGPVAVDAWHFPGTSAESLAELEAALETIELR
jgi:Tol biopolymer transport system component